MNYAALCSGIGGLELAVETVAPDARLAWHAETDPHAADVHDRHWPGVPNIGDITRADWGSLEPVDLICAGIPCQPFSTAGARKGLEDDRWLWPAMFDAVRVLRPRWVLLENVGGFLSAGLGPVLGDLAEAGYDAEWCCVRASDVGAPHRRERLFLLAADACGERRSRDTGAASVEEEPRRRREPHDRHVPDDPCGRRPFADADGGRFEVGSELDGEPVEPGLAASRRSDIDRRGDVAADATDDGRHGTGPARRGGARPVDSRGAAAGADSAGLERRRPRPSGTGERSLGTGGLVDWGPYEPAIRRWERLTRPVPRPTDDRRRLNPDFVEWLIGLPEGWTAGPSRNRRLKMLGNAVVPQQAAHALAVLADAWTEQQGAA